MNPFKIKNKKLRITRIGVYLFDLLSFVSYFLIANILKGMFAIVETIIILVLIIVAGLFLRNFLIVKLYNSSVDYVNTLEKDNVENV